MITGVFRECSEKSCRFRFPAELHANGKSDRCPRCGGKALIVEKVTAITENNHIGIHPLSQCEILPVLDNIRSVYNVGSIFRTANGFGVTQIVLGGITPTPDHPRFAKTSLGAELSIQWEYVRNTPSFISKLKEDDYQIICLEKTTESILLEDLPKCQLTKKLALVVGNEKMGVDPQIMRSGDFLCAIPMLGTKESHNVCVAFGIALFQLTNILSNSSKS